MVVWRLHYKQGEIEGTTKKKCNERFVELVVAVVVELVMLVGNIRMCIRTHFENNYVSMLCMQLYTETKTGRRKTWFFLENDPTLCNVYND